MAEPLAALQIFAKYPEAGKVKTRLIDSLGAEEALKLYVELLESKLQLASGLPAHVRVELWGTEAASAPFYQNCCKRWSNLHYHRQSGNSLGERLEGALRSSLARSKIVVQIGADCPVLTAGHILDAIDSVDQDDTAYFIPAEDGGYVLAAYPSYFQGMFDDIEWGGATVMRETVSNFTRAGHPCRQIAPLWDIDRPEDLKRYRGLKYKRN